MVNRPRQARQIGRVRVFLMVAGKLDAAEDPALGSELVVRREEREDGCLQLWIDDPNGDQLSQVLIAGETHLDLYYGRYSMPSAAYCYGSQLEVTPAARGRGIATYTMRMARAAAADHFGKGIYGLIQRANAASMACHLRAGYVTVARLDGLRTGGQVRWLPARAVGP